jgi:hypothetical protein
MSAVSRCLSMGSAATSTTCRVWRVLVRAATHLAASCSHPPTAMRWGPSPWSTTSDPCRASPPGHRADGADGPASSTGRPRDPAAPRSPPRRSGCASGRSRPRRRASWPPPRHRESSARLSCWAPVRRASTTGAVHPRPHLTMGEGRRRVYGGNCYTSHGRDRRDSSSPGVAGVNAQTTSAGAAIDGDSAAPQSAAVLCNSARYRLALSMWIKSSPDVAADHRLALFWSPTVVHVMVRSGALAATAGVARPLPRDWPVTDNHNMLWSDSTQATICCGSSRTPCHTTWHPAVIARARSRADPERTGRLGGGLPDLPTPTFGRPRSLVGWGSGEANAAKSCSTTMQNAAKLGFLGPRIS